MARKKRNTTTIPIEVTTFSKLLEIKAELTQLNKKLVTWNDVIEYLIKK